MDIQAYLQQHFSKKRIILVGNAFLAESRSDLIDAHDLVVRFNLFRNSAFLSGMAGQKINCWCVNLGTGRKCKKKRAERNEYCSWIRSLDNQINVITPYEEDGHHRLANVKKYYPDHGLTVIYPDDALQTGLSKQPSVGYYMAFRLLSLSIPIAVIGFTGQTTDRHDGQEENRRLRNDPMVTFHETHGRRILNNLHVR